MGSGALKLTIVGGDQSVPELETIRIVERDGVTIGRNPPSEWVLIDPSRRISGVHCRIDWRDGRYFITDANSKNGVYLNGSRERLGPNESMPLGDGDIFGLCHPSVYAIEVGFLDSERAEGGTVGGSNGLAGVDKDKDKDKDKVGTEFEWWKESPSKPAPTSPSDESVRENGDVAEEDDWWRDPETERFSATPSPLQDSHAGGDEEDAAAVEHAGEKHVSVGEAKLDSVSPADPATSREDVASPPRDGYGGSISDAGQQQPRQSSERLEQLLREVVRGLLELLEARNSVRAGLHIQGHTRMGGVDVNPFKAPELTALPRQSQVEKVMQLLLGPDDPAYLPPIHAVRDAFNDLKAHELAIMAGMKAAHARLLERFHPENLESRLERGSLMNNFIPGSRKAHYWEEFQKYYAEIAEEAKDDFRKLFDGEFERAYEEQVRLLNAHREPAE